MERRKQKSGIGMAIFIALLVIAVCFIGYQYFRVAKIEVEGNGYVDADYIATLSGIEIDDNLFAIDKDKVAQYINSDPYLEFFDLKRIYPSAVRIEVYERQPAALVIGREGNYIVDKEGRVLERMAEAPSNYVLVRGLALSEAVTGEKLVAENTYDFNALVNILKDVKYNELTEIITEMDLSDINNITMSTRTGFYIEFGQAEKVSNKILWILAVVNELTQKNITTGTINVVAGEFATYREPEG